MASWHGGGLSLYPVSECQECQATPGPTAVVMSPSQAQAHGDIFTVLAPKKIVKKAIKVHSTWQLNCSNVNMAKSSLRD